MLPELPLAWRLVAAAVIFIGFLVACVVVLRWPHRYAAQRAMHMAGIRCKCGYDLTGNVVPRCPECGCAIGFDTTFEELGLSEAEVQRLVAVKKSRDEAKAESMTRQVPAVFLDRDGVLNRTTVRNGTPYPPSSAAEVEILPGVADALKRLSDAGLPLLVVTNQPDVARGTQTREAIEQINARLSRELPTLTAFYVCYHDNADRCDCRKPSPGLLKQAAAEHGIDLSRSFMVGDRWSDVVAGAAAGCKTFLFDVPYSQCQKCTPDYVVADLAEAAERILSLLNAAI